MITLDSDQRVIQWDIMSCKIIEEFHNLSYEEACKQKSTYEWVANWCIIDTKLGYLSVILEEGKCNDGLIFPDEIGMEPDDGKMINLGRWILSLLFKNYFNSLNADGKETAYTLNNSMDMQIDFFKDGQFGIEQEVPLVIYYDIINIFRGVVGDLKNSRDLGSCLPTWIPDWLFSVF